MAAVRGTPAAGWLGIVGCNREEVTVAEIQEAEELEEDCREADEAALCSLGGDVFGPRVVTLDRVRQELAGDKVLRCVRTVVEGDLEWPQQLGELRRFWGSFSVVDGGLMYGDRVVVPVGLRIEVLATLHAGHQGTTIQSIA